MRGLRLIVAGLVGALMAATPALAASGTALGVKPAAEADTNGAARVLTVGADVFIGDNIKTGPKGQVQIKFSDSTELVVGPNSSLIIEDYLLREDNSAGKFAINALSGAFRFATGEADHGKYVIKTPTGTIGVRGTEFDFTVEGDTKVMLYNGEVALCDLNNQCVTLNNTCDIGTIDPTQSQVLGNVDDIFGKQRQDLRASFIYAQSQMPLLSEFRFANALQCFNRGLRMGPPPDSLIKDTSSGGNNHDNCECGCGGEGGYTYNYYDEGGCGDY